MSDEPALHADQKSEDDPATAGSQSMREVDCIRQDVHKTIGEIKGHFGLLLELRDRKISDLEKATAAVERDIGGRILVVDDAASTPDIMNKYLTGCPVELVFSAGNRAAELVDSEDYAAIIIEGAANVGPDEDGMDLCRLLCEKDSAMKVVVMSSRPGDTIKESVEELGAEFLRKPFRREQLVNLVQTKLLGDEQ